MRVTSHTFPQNLTDQLGRLATRQNELQKQAATGQRIHNPEDDPGSFRRLSGLDTEAKKLGQYRRNIDRLNELASANYQAADSLSTIVKRAREIASGASELNASNANVHAQEVDQLIEQALQIANSKNRDTYLFSGTKTETIPFEAERVDGRITAVSYQGNADLPENAISDQTRVSGRILGSSNDPTSPRGLIEDASQGADLFRHLIQLRDKIETGDIDGIRQEVNPALGNDEDNLIYHVGALGAHQLRLEVTEASHRARGFAVENMVSKEADADLAQTIVSLNQVQNAYRAALQSGANILNNSLMDFL